MKRLALVLCTLLLPLPVMAKSSAPHAESCVHDNWGFLTFHDKQYATVNACQYGVSIWFLRREGPPISATIKPGGVFKTGLKAGTFDGSDWAAAICPEKRVPKPDATRANWDTILNSKYECVKK